VKKTESIRNSAFPSVLEKTQILCWRKLILFLLLRPYSKSKFELNSKKSKSSEVKKFYLCLYHSFLHLKPNLSYSQFELCQIKFRLRERTTVKLSINLQNDSNSSLLLEYGC